MTQDTLVDKEVAKAIEVCFSLIDIFSHRKTTTTLSSYYYSFVCTVLTSLRDLTKEQREEYIASFRNFKTPMFDCTTNDITDLSVDETKVFIFTKTDWNSRFCNNRYVYWEDLTDHEIQHIARLYSGTTE